LGKRISGRHVPITEYLPDLPSNFVRVLDKMMAHKPHERFASAVEVADALQNLIRPRAKSIGNEASTPAGAGGKVASRAGSVDASNAAPVNAAETSPAPPTFVKVQPSYPRWFAPLAGLAESRPGGALAILILTVSLAFGSGLLLGLALK
jgi:serine/threonine-protein kinase